MPCYTVQTTTVAVGKINLDRMAEVAQSDGWTVMRTSDRLTITKGAMRVAFTAGNENAEIRGPASVSATVSALKRTYAAKTVAEAARRHGWKVKSQTAENNTITLKIGR